MALRNRGTKDSTTGSMASGGKTAKDAPSSSWSIGSWVSRPGGMYCIAVIAFNTVCGPQASSMLFTNAQLTNALVYKTLTAKVGPILLWDQGVMGLYMVCMMSYVITGTSYMVKNFSSTDFKQRLAWISAFVFIILFMFYDGGILLPEVHSYKFRASDTFPYYTDDPSAPVVTLVKDNWRLQHDFFSVWWKGVFYNSFCCLGWLHQYLMMPYLLKSYGATSMLSFSRLLTHLMYGVMCVWPVLCYYRPLDHAAYIAAQPK